MLCGMKLLRVFATFFGMALVLGYGLWLLMNQGHPWLLLAGLAAFALAFARLGCLSH